MNYHLFAFDRYYPEGGIADYKGSARTLEAAREMAFYARRGWDYDYWQILKSTPDGLVLLETADASPWTPEDKSGPLNWKTVETPPSPPPSNNHATPDD